MDWLRPEREAIAEMNHGSPETWMKVVVLVLMLGLLQWNEGIAAVFLVIALPYIIYILCCHHWVNVLVTGALLVALLTFLVLEYRVALSGGGGQAGILLVIFPMVTVPALMVQCAVTQVLKRRRYVSHEDGPLDRRAERPHLLTKRNN